jgi:hypothetical protein
VEEDDRVREFRVSGRQEFCCLYFAFLLWELGIYIFPPALAPPRLQPPSPNAEKLL